MQAERKIITDRLTIQKTGLSLEQCFQVLDNANARKLDHAGIYKLISEIDEFVPLGEWNQNLLATSYEWSRGLKQRGERPGGFEISVSKTASVAANILFSYFADNHLRAQWLSNKLAIRKCTPGKSARITWEDGASSLSVDFYEKGKDKSQVVVQHQKLPDREKADLMKRFWSEKLDALSELLKSRS